VLDSDGRLEYINAGHPPPLVLRRGQIVEPFLENSFPVGLIPEAQYKVSSVQLEDGDTIVLFSDGVSEAMDPEENMFGHAGLVQAIQGQQAPALDDLQKVILDSVERFARGASQADDLTVLLVRYRTPAPSTTE
jgi:sigma-B regulation protein RsbU (phosphoserine phosphatase)